MVNQARRWNRVSIVSTLLTKRKREGEIVVLTKSGQGSESHYHSAGFLTRLASHSPRCPGNTQSFPAHSRGCLVCLHPLKWTKQDILLLLSHPVHNIYISSAPSDRLEQASAGDHSAITREDGFCVDFPTPRTCICGSATPNSVHPRTLYQPWDHRCHHCNRYCRPSENPRLSDRASHQDLRPYNYHRYTYRIISTSGESETPRCDSLGLPASRLGTYRGAAPHCRHSLRTQTQ